jgi:pyrroline-5-carboxylate reductase
MRFIKDLVDFAVDSGMSSEDAEVLVIQTVIGSAEMIKKSDCDVQQLIKNVTSPNGTTEAGLRSLDVNDFDNILKLCLEATVNRAKELSK